MRGTWVYRNGRLVEKGGPQDVRLQPPRSDLPCPMLIGDIMDEAEHVDGRFYTSKSQFRKVTKANGLIEVGNERPKARKRPDPKAREKSIEQSIDKAIARAC